MIIREKINENIVKYYSDQLFKIKEVETGIIYSDVYTLIPEQFTYEETDEKIEVDEDYYIQLAEHYKTLLDTISGE